MPKKNTKGNKEEPSAPAEDVEMAGNESDEGQAHAQKRKDNKAGGKGKGGAKGRRGDEDEDGENGADDTNGKASSTKDTPKKGGKGGNKKGGKGAHQASDDEGEAEAQPQQKGKKNQKRGGGDEGQDDHDDAPAKGSKGKKSQQQQQSKSAADSDEETPAPQKGGKGQGKSAAKPAAPVEEDAEVETPTSKKGQQKDTGKNKKPAEDAAESNKKESDDEMPAGMVKKAQKGKKKGKQSAKAADSDEEDKTPAKAEESEEEEVIGMAKKKGNNKKAKKAKSKAAAQDDNDEAAEAAPAEVVEVVKSPPQTANKANKNTTEDEAGVAPAAAKPPPAKKKANKKSKQAMDDGLGDMEEEDAPPTPKAITSGFAALTIEGDFGDEDDEAPKKKKGKKKGAKKAEPVEEATKPQKDEDAEEEQEEDKTTTEKKAAEPKISRKERLKAKREAKGKPKQAAAEEVEEEEQLDDYQKYLLAQEMKGMEAPTYVHLRTTAAERSKTGNDIKADNLNITVPGRVLVRESNLTLVYGGRYGLIGRNGLGKSTILHHIAERNDVYVPPHLRILYVEQEVPGDDTTPLEYVLKADVEREWLLKEEKLLQDLEVNNPDYQDDPKLKRAYTLKDIYDRLRDIESEKAVARASAILVGLGFGMEDIKSKPSREFSGGWRMRIALARALFCRPEVLLLDEPTNHLDLHACFWLERYLSKWPKTLVVVSHEAAFLNEVVDHIILLKEKTLTTYKGDYRHFVKSRDVAERGMAKKKDKQDRQITKLQKQSQKGQGSKAGAQAKDKLSKIDVKKVERDDPSLKVDFPDPDYQPPPLLRFCDVSFGYDPKKLLFKHLEFGIDMDSKIALVGLNGVGKSTLMKLMAGELHEVDGYVEKSRKIRVARFSQHAMEQLDASVSPVEYFQQRFGEAGSVHDIRQHLGRFGISGNLGTNPIDTLSGGQKSRVVLAELAWAHPHILMLDEPSNHLDIDAIEALAHGLKKFQGGVVLISHNQRLISKVCKTILVVTKKGTVEEFNGDFDTYKESILAQMDFGDED